MTTLSWDNFYLGMAMYVSFKSKDPSTKVGCVIVRPDNSVASLGFNGFPQSMPDTIEFYENREEKYSRIIHAEMNAILLSTDPNMKGCTAYTYPFQPCDRCFVAMVQKGITRYVAPKPKPEQLTRWGEAFEKVKKYAVECNVELLELDFAQQ